MTRTLSAWAVGLAFLLLPSALVAQDAGRWVPKGWEISPFVGIFADEPEFDPGGSSSVYVDPERNVYLGGHLSYNFASGWFIEGEGGYMTFDLKPPTQSVVGMDLMLFSAGLGYNVPFGSRIQGYGVAGVGASRWSPQGFASETDLMLSYGGGLRVSLGPGFALRFDARMHQVPDALANTSSAVAGAAVDPRVLSEETFWGWGLTAGASFFPGRRGPRDSDGDGVEDGTDACPDTPMGVSVDARGCALDTDGDGVADPADRCPGTPAGARVDADGCPTDGDDDGVADGLDRCPNTRAGARVDANGCATDADGDRVPDGIDRCPNTRRGAQVDRNGCARDGDGDGVPDGIDRCPDTPAGVEVDETGCRIQLDPVSFSGVNFAHDSAELDDAAGPILQQVGRALASRPDDRLQVTGHADSTGTEAFNMELGILRAQVVVDYLVANFPDLDANRFGVRSAGESQPIADNETAEGRRENRRVEIVLGGEQ